MDRVNPRTGLGRQFGVGEQLAVTGDDRDGRAQLMAGRGEEVLPLPFEVVAHLDGGGGGTRGFGALLRGVDRRAGVAQRLVAFGGRQNREDRERGDEGGDRDGALGGVDAGRVEHAHAQPAEQHRRQRDDEGLDLGEQRRETQGGPRQRHEDEECERQRAERPDARRDDDEHHEDLRRRLARTRRRLRLPSKSARGTISSTADRWEAQVMIAEARGSPSTRVMLMSAMSRAKTMAETADRATNCTASVVVRRRASRPRAAAASPASPLRSRSPVRTDR
jgi:hypothetical protein